MGPAAVTGLLVPAIFLLPARMKEKTTFGSVYIFLLLSSISTFIHEFIIEFVFTSYYIFRNDLVFSLLFAKVVLRFFLIIIIYIFKYI